MQCGQGKERTVHVDPIFSGRIYTEPCVFCDGKKFSTLRISFPDPASRVSYMEKFCGKDFEDCPVYDAFVRHM